MLEAYLELGFRGRVYGWELCQWGLVHGWLDYLRGPNILGKVVRLLGCGIEIVIGRTRRERRMNVHAKVLVTCLEREEDSRLIISA